MGGKYSDYIQVNEDFIPVFDEGWDKKYPKRWKSFYPHRDFLEILQAVLATLEGARNEDRKSLWVSGAYGTGKTFASFVIQHLFEDPIEDVEDYFRVHRLNTSLLNRLVGLRNRGKILIARRSASSGITHDYLLFGALQNSIIESLKKRNCQYLGSQSLYEEVVERLSHPDSPFDFPKVFKRVRNRLFPEYKSPEDVIRDLKERSPEQNKELLWRSIQLLFEEKQNIVVDPQKIRVWVVDVIRGNKIDALLFIWDEFSDYFRQNRALTGLQEIAQTASSAPFYLFLITHKDYGQFLNDEQDRKRIMDRFKAHSIYMSEPTALQLMANVIQVKPEREGEWQKLSEELWSTIKLRIQSLFEAIGDDSMRLESLRKLIPIHPYSAFLLSILSRFLSSNQRTMFQFLSGNGGDSFRNFRWFIENHGAERGKLLTCELLWDYFFIQGNTEIPGNLRWIVNRLEDLERRLKSDEEVRVLKAVFLLFAVQKIFAVRETRRDSLSAFMVPTLSNLSLAFAGTELEETVRPILDRLVEQRILYAHKEWGDVQYILQEEITDPQRYNEILEQVRQERPFEKILEVEHVEKWIREKLSPVYLQERFQGLKCVPPKNWKAFLHSPPPDGYVPLVAIFASGNEEQKELDEEIREYLATLSFDCVVVDATCSPFGKDKLEKYWEKEAEVRYFKQGGGKDDQCKLCEEQRQSIVQEWLAGFKDTRFKVYYRIEGRNQSSWSTKSQVVEGLDGLREELELIDKNIFYWGLETIAEHETLFKPKQFSREVFKMGTGVAKIEGRYKYLLELESNLKGAGVWNEENYWEKEHTDQVAQAVVAMKRKVEEIIESRLEEAREVKIQDIYIELQKKPFGLLGWAGTLFLLGFLLRDYCKSRQYYRYDGKSTVLLNEDTLADMVFATIRKDDVSASIIKMTKEQEFFCECAAIIFPCIDAHQKFSLKGVQNAIRDYLHRAGYPLWSAQFVKGLEEKGSAINEIIELFCQFVACHYQVSDEDPQSEPEIVTAEKIAQKIVGIDLLISRQIFEESTLQSPDVKNLLNQLYDVFRPDSLKVGLQNYLSTKWPRLSELTRQMGLNEEALLRMIKKRVAVDATWLWDKEDFEKKVAKLQDEMEALSILRQYFSEKVTEDDTLEAYLRRVFLPVKISYAYIQDEVPESRVLREVIRVCQDQNFEIADKRAFLQAFKADGNVLASVITEEGFVRTIEKRSQEIFSTPLTKGEIAELYEHLPAEQQFLSSRDDFVATLRRVWEEYQTANKLSMLRKTWKELSETISPREWSKKHKMPVFWVLGEEPWVYDLCEALEGKRKVEAYALEQAKNLLEKSDKVAYLRDLEKCNELLIHRLFPGREELLPLLVGKIEELKTYIAENLSEEPYEWYLSTSKVQDIAHEYWGKLYRERYVGEALKRVQAMEVFEAKQWLEKSVQRDPWIGMAVLAEALRKP